ncbi:MAG: ribokinase [Paracoccaceae bacterium]|jgi:ribokinase|nr:ribokinase [Paracoccaceae bacterium]
MADIVVLGIFNADTTYRAARQPAMGETILGESFALRPGGKGSNQAVAAARAGGRIVGRVAMLTRLGDDAFADLALATWAAEGIAPHAPRVQGGQTGAAYVFVEAGTGDNAIIVCPGAAATISTDDVDGWANVIGAARVLVTQLEQPVDAAHRALQIACAAGVTTILNPAPAAALPQGMLALCDVVTPNATEAGALTGVAVDTREGAEKAAAALCAAGAGAAILTLGATGALVHDGRRAVLVPGLSAGPVVETTGAGDAFTGGLAVALAEGRPLEEAVRFATATAALSVTKAGTVPAMPARAEIDALLERG